MWFGVCGVVSAWWCPPSVLFVRVGRRVLHPTWGVRRAASSPITGGFRCSCHPAVCSRKAQAFFPKALPGAAVTGSAFTVRHPSRARSLCPKGGSLAVRRLCRQWAIHGLNERCIRVGTKNSSALGVCRRRNVDWGSAVTFRLQIGRPCMTDLAPRCSKKCSELETSKLSRGWIGRSEG